MAKGKWRRRRICSKLRGTLKSPKVGSRRQRSEFFPFLLSGPPNHLGPTRPPPLPLLPSFLSEPAGRRKTEGERERRFFQVSQSPPSPLIDRAKRRRRERTGRTPSKILPLPCLPRGTGGKCRHCSLSCLWVFRQVVPERFSVLELVVRWTLFSFSACTARSTFCQICSFLPF